MKALNGIALALLLALVALAPLPIGSDAPWAKAAVFLAVGAAAMAWVAGGVAGRSLPVVRSLALVFIVLFFVIGFLQLQPLPRRTLASLSPNATVMRERALPAEEAAADAPLSLNPHATRSALFRYGACAIVFVLVGSLVRTKRAVVWAVAVLLAAGLFQVVYALGESVYGGQHVFWAPKREYSHAFTGTFFNKNHFAGFLEMLLPLAVVLVAAVRRSGAPYSGPSTRQKIIHTFSEPSTQKRILLMIPATLLAVGVALSMSRAGVVCSFVALWGVAVVAIVSRRKRQSLVLACALIAVAGAVLLVASGPLVDQFEGAFAGPMRTVSARVDRLQSAWKLFRDFPLTGTGLGTLSSVFGRYQSANLGNISVHYVVNDWAHIACEMGLVGLAVVAGGLLCFCGSTLRAALQRHDRYCRWVAIGCLAGVAAMMLHSFVDFNLTRTTSNAVLFAALLGLAHAAARTEKHTKDGKTRSGVIAVPLGPRICGSVLAVVVCFPLLMLMWKQAQAFQADIRYNCHLKAAGRETDLYHFLPLSEAKGDAAAAAHYDLEEARKRDPGNPVYEHALGQLKRDEIERNVERVARAAAAADLPGMAEENPEEFERLLDIFRRPAQLALAEEIRERGVLRDAEEAFRRAIRIAPTVPWHHLALAETLALKSRLETKLDPESDAWRASRRAAQQEIDRAAYFAPTRAEVLFDGARLLLADAMEMGGAERARGIARAKVFLRPAIYAAPAEKAREAYLLLESVGVETSEFFKVTPRTLRAYRALGSFLWDKALYRSRGDERAWEYVLAALDALEQLLGEVRVDEFIGAPAAPSVRASVADASDPPETMPPAFSWASEDAPTLELQLGIARKRVTVLGLLGRWEGRAAALRQYAVLIGRATAIDTQAGQALFDDGRFVQAMRCYERILGRAPHDTDALIGMAAVTSVPFVRDAAHEFYDPLPCLFRIAVNSDSLTPAQHDRIAALLEDVAPSDERGKVVKEFVECVVCLLRTAGGGASQFRTTALQRLHKLSGSVSEAVTHWRQRHLIWYYLGRGYESAGDLPRARKMYANVLGLVPGHTRSLRKLVELAAKMSDTTATEQYRRELDRLTPEHACFASFGGAIRFLGYSTRKAGTVRCYWEFLEPFPMGYGARTRFFDASWRIVRIDAREIVPAGGFYPSDLARCGEVVVEERPLAAVPPEAACFDLAVVCKKPPADWPKVLPRDGWSGLPRFKFVRPAP